MYCPNCAGDHDEQAVREFGRKLYELDCDVMWTLDAEYICKEFCRDQKFWAGEMARRAAAAPAA